MKKHPKPAKEKAKEPVLKEQDRIEIELKEELQESTSEQGFTQAEETLLVDEVSKSEDSLSGWIYKPSDEEVLAQGTVVDGKYEIICLLGHGGMGSVYLARHKELGTQVALKVLHRFLVNTKSAVERFKTEARAAHTLSSKNLVSVLDYGVLGDGQPYLTMHCIDGVNLADYLKTHGALSISDTFSLVRQVSTALEEAHSKGIVHRDIKPSNILIEGNTIKDGSVKVVDFGISKGVWGDENAQQVTHTGQVFGSPFYMSPEQCKGENVDFRTDLYSLGCVMFECLTGSRPFQASNVIKTMMMHCDEPPPTLGVKGKPPSGFSEAKAILKKLLAKNPAQRFENATALSKALDIDTGFSPSKIFAIGRAAAGDMLFQREMMRISVMIAILISVYALLQMNQKFVQNPDPQLRLGELYELASEPTTWPTGELSIKTEGYLKEALDLAESCYGRYNIHVAKAYNHLGRFYGSLYGQPEYRIKAHDNYKNALQIIDRLAKDNPSLYSQGRLNVLRQNYILDLAGADNSDQEKEMLYQRALALGPLPREDTQGHWFAHQAFLYKKGRLLEAAKIFLEKYKQSRLSTSESTFEFLAKQPAASVAGSFSIAPNQNCNMLDGRINLMMKGSKFTGELNGRPSDSNGQVVKYPLTGAYSQGVLKTKLLQSGLDMEYSIVRIGKNLVVLGPEITDKNSYHSFTPAIIDAVFESNE